MAQLFTWDPVCGASAYLLGIVAGSASMFIYMRLSPQGKLDSLKAECSAVQKQLSSYDGDFSGAMALTGLNLRLTFRRLGLALGPSLLAGVPVAILFCLVGDFYYPFLLATVVTAVAIKYVYKIS